MFLKKDDIEHILYEYKPGTLIKFINNSEVFIKNKKNDEDNFERTAIDAGTPGLIICVNRKQSLGFQSIEFEILLNEKTCLFHTTVNPFQLIEIVCKQMK